METVDTKILIYCLKHPDTLEVRYIGMTSKTLKYRLSKHIDNAKYTKHNKHLCNWILNILKLNKKPIIELIEKVDFNKWQDKEKFYISLYSSKRLLNSTMGGEGTFGFKHNATTIKKLRDLKTGIIPSKEALIKRSISLKNRVITKEHRLKISNSNRGKIYTKYKILVRDITTGADVICDSVRQVHIQFNIGEITVRRNLNKNTVVKKKYILVKI